MKQSVSTIFFDAGGVLFSTGLSKYSRVSDILAARGYSQEIIHSGLNQANEYYQYVVTRGEIISDWDKEQELWNRYYGRIADVVDKTNKHLKDELFFLTHYAQHCQLYDEVRSVLERLREEKYRLAVISNAFPSMDWAFDLLNIRKYFEHIVLSAIVGTNKPDEKIFIHAMDAMKVTPEESLFIDDRKEHIEAAEKLGMKTMQLLRPDHDLNALRLYLN